MKMENVVSPHDGASLPCLLLSAPHILTLLREEGENAELASRGEVPMGVSFPPKDSDWGHINLACMNPGHAMVVNSPETCGHG